MAVIRGNIPHRGGSGTYLWQGFVLLFLSKCTGIGSDIGAGERAAYEDVKACQAADSFGLASVFGECWGSGEGWVSSPAQCGVEFAAF